MKYVREIIGKSESGEQFKNVGTMKRKEATVEAMKSLGSTAVRSIFKHLDLRFDYLQKLELFLLVDLSLFKQYKITFPDKPCSGLRNSVYSGIFGLDCVFYGFDKICDVLRGLQNVNT